MGMKDLYYEPQKAIRNANTHAKNRDHRAMVRNAGATQEKKTEEKPVHNASQTKKWGS